MNEREALINLLALLTGWSEEVFKKYTDEELEAKYEEQMER